ncbi:MAG: hypothetical protein KAT15_03270 [Bacteroidales bacterium]|nr:hypothetical protein [Bacteroidales bacterium]
MKLNKRAYALSAGVILGVAILVITLVFLIFNHEGHQLAKLHKVFIGYKVSWLGAFLGLLWGFIYGVIGGWLFAWLYNRLEK